MALSGSYKNNFFREYGIELDWTATQNIADNTSTVTAKLYWCSYHSSFTVNSSATKTGRIVIDGTTYSFTTAGASLNGNQRKLIATKSKTITHDDTGKKSFSVSGTYDCEVTLSGQWFGSVSVSGSATLNTIPRASSLTSDANWTAGGNLNLYISRASSSFTHTAKIYVNGNYIKSETGIGTSRGVSFTEAQHTEMFQELAQKSTEDTKIVLETYNGSSLIGTKTYTGTLTAPQRSTTGWGGSFNIGDTIGGNITRHHSDFTHTIVLIAGGEWFYIKNKITETTWDYDTDAIASQLYAKTPNSNTLPMEIRIYTYYNDVQVRSYASSTFSAYVTNSNPTIGDLLSYSDTNQETVNITNNNQKIIQNESTVRAVLPVSSKATALNSATIKEYIATLGGVQKTAPYSETTDVVFDFGTINSMIDQTLTIKAIDSRGNSASLTKTVTVIPYSPPTINASAKRENGFGNITTLAMNGTISPITIDGVMKNSVISVQYRYKNTNVETATTWDLWTDFIFSTLDNTYLADEVLLDLPTTESFHIEFIVQDQLGNLVFATTVSNGQPLFFVDHVKKSIGVNQFAEYNNCLEVKGDFRVNVDTFAGLRIKNTTAGTDPSIYLQTHQGNEWSIRNDDSNNNVFEVRYNNIAKFQLDTNGSIHLPSNAGLYSDYNNDYFLKDHANGNVTVSATGGDLYLGYKNTAKTRLSTDLHSADGTLRIIDSTGGQFSTHNPLNTGASCHYGWMNDIARVRWGGNGTGATNGFQFQGSGDSLKAWIKDDGFMYCYGSAPITGNYFIRGGSYEFQFRSLGSHQAIYSTGNAHLKWLSSSFTIQCRSNTDGSYGTFQGQIADVSDRRIKRNINLVEESFLEKIDNSPIYSFNKEGHDDSEIFYGLITDEAPEEIVIPANDEDEHESINLYMMSSFLWKAVQELSKETKELRAEIKELKAEKSKSFFDFLKRKGD